MTDALHPSGETEREARADRLAERLHGPVTVLGVLFVLVVVGETLAEPGSDIQLLLAIAGWAIWSLFVVEFLARLWIAPSIVRFLKRNWWQALFLIVPFLRFLALLRVSRAARAVSSAVRAGRSAGAKLSGRVGWLVGATLIVILGSADLLVEIGEFDSMGTALRAATIATITGEPMDGSSGLAQVLDVFLAAYSIVVFATLAGALGAFFLERPRELSSDS